MQLWINPFLDTFYEWGLDKYWDDKLSFIVFLDQGNMKGEQVGGIKEYIKENVPEWYWRYGVSWWIGTGDYTEILKSWVEDKPYLYKDRAAQGVNQEELMRNTKLYEGYPEYLKSNGKMIRLYVPSSHPYVQLLKIGGGFFNALYFTAVKGKSWCNIQEKGTFINWPNENPLEVK